jgi:adenylosuccinate lyase
MHLKPSNFDKSEIYISPLSGRYCSDDAKILTGEAYRWSCIRSVWIAVLETQMEMKLFSNPPSDEALETFKYNIDNFDWSEIRKIEKELKHDVMAHITYITKHLIPNLGDVVHVSMTSEDATSNGEIIQQKEWIKHIIAYTINFLEISFEQIEKFKSLPMLGETHLQPAAAVTLGKRIAMWVGPIIEDLIRLDNLIYNWNIKGIRGATGTYEAMLKLFDGDFSKVKNFQISVSEKLDIGITELVPGQTAHRSMDVELLSCFTSLGNNLAKFATDLRHLARTGEIGEPRGKNQVGSSAMPWKQNPMKAERLNSLARTLPGFKLMADMTQQVQGLERTLDDSAGRRIYMPESFLVVDACLRLATELMEGLNVFENVVETRLNKMLPFLATEEILSLAVKQGAPRQETHHIIMEECKVVWANIANGITSDNELISRLQNGGYKEFEGVIFPEQLDSMNYIGACERVCDDFLSTNLFRKVVSISTRYPKVKSEKSEV